MPDNILGIPKVREYKYLGVLIDEQLRFKSELKHKKQMEQNLQRAKWILSAKHLDEASSYHLWLTLFRSRIWYAALLIAAENKEMASWLSSYFYRSIKTLFHIKGNPSTNRLLKMSTGVTSQMLVYRIEYSDNHL